MIVDFTILSAVASCSTLAALRHVLGLVSLEEAAALRCGQAVHHALAAWLLGASQGRALQAFDQHYQLWAEANVGPEDRLAWPNARRCVEAWLRFHPVERLPFKVVTMDRGQLAVEQPLRAPLGEVGGEQIIMVGIADALATAKASGGFWIVDHKSTGSLTDYWKTGEKTSAQHTGYLWLAEEVFGRDVSGSFINGLEIRHLNTSDRKCYKHGVAYCECATAPEHLHAEIMPITRTAAHIEAWRRTTLKQARKLQVLRQHVEVLEDVAGVAMEGAFNGKCRFCQFQKFCSLGRPVHMAKGMFGEEHWEPEVSAKKRQEEARKIARVVEREGSEDGKAGKGRAKARAQGRGEAKARRAAG